MPVVPALADHVTTGCALLAVLVSAAVLLRAHPPDRALAGPLLLALGGAVVALVLVPKAPWAMDHRGLEAWVFEQDEVLLARQTAEHGVAAHWTWWWLGRLLPRAVHPWGASLVASTLSVVLLGGLVRTWTGRRAAGLLAAGILATSPIHLRLAVSASPYVATELWLLVALVGLTLAARDRLAGWVLGGAAAVLAVGTRADAAAVVPVICLGSLAGVPALRRQLVRPPVAAVTLLAAGAAGLRLAGALGAADAEELDVLQRHALPDVLAQWGLLAGVAFLGGIAPARWLRPLGVAALGLALLSELAWRAPGADTVWPELPPHVAGVVLHQPLLHPLLVPPVVGVAAFAGLGLLARRAPALAATALAALVASTTIHELVVGSGSPGFYLRAAGLGLWAVAAAAGSGLVAAGTRGALRVAAVLAVLAAVQVAARHTLVTHRFDLQAELDVLWAARALGDEAPVVALELDDLEPPLTPDAVVDERDAARLALAPVAGHARPPLRSVRQALAAPAAVVGGWWLHGLACHRPLRLRSSHRPAVDPDATVVAFGGRVWAVPQRVDPEPELLRPPAPLPLVTPEELACAADPTHARCLLPGEPCAAWACATPAPAADLEEPACAAMREAFVLAPVRVHHPGPVTLGNSGFRPLSRDPVVGLYRITGVRQRTQIQAGSPAEVGLGAGIQGKW
ncbi:MAG: glycosyltransferase family 39 protein [Alphaproteobacteria bacterium]|nr:glycosyltransferase family 39 protein [Alphaproteobacteria bacterium]